MVIIKEKKDKYWGGFEELVLLYTLAKYKMVQLLCKRLWRFPKRLKIEHHIKHPKGLLDI